MNRVLVYHPQEARTYAALLEPRLEELALDVAVAEDPETVASALPEASILIASNTFPTELLATHARSLAWIHVQGAGVDRWMEADLPKGVRLTRTVGTFGERMAEYALASILAVRQHLHLYRDDQHSRSWSPRLAVPLHGARLGVAGYGAIGRSLAVAAERFGMRVHGLARRARRDEGRDVLATDQLQAFVSRSDIVVNVLPRTPNTTRLFDDVAFRAMPEGAWFLNMGRGATVDQTALVDALRDGHLGGAVLDVFETEPLPREDPLWSMPNVIVTPHVAGTTDPREVVDAFEQNVPHFRAGDPMHDEVDRHRGY